MRSVRTVINSYTLVVNLKKKKNFASLVKAQDSVTQTQTNKQTNIHTGGDSRKQNNNNIRQTSADLQEQTSKQTDSEGP